MSMKFIDSKMVMADSLEMAFNLSTYIEIMDEIALEGFTINQDFQTKYSGYYRVRQKSEADIFKTWEEQG